MKEETAPILPVRTREDALSLLHMIAAVFFAELGEEMPESVSPAFVGGLIAVGAFAPEWAVRLLAKASRGEPENALFTTVAGIVAACPIE